MRLARFDLTNPAVRRLIWLLSLATVLSILRWFPPEQSAFYPRCPIFQATGWLCPGCGGTRALAALARGDLAGAWQSNALVVGLIPLFLLAIWREFRVRREIWMGLAAVAGLFSVWRNLA